MNLANAWHFDGHLGSVPELRDLGDIKVASVGLATQKNWKDKNGEWQKNVQWHRLKFWGDRAETAMQLEKGSRITGWAELLYNEWEDKNGNSRKDAELKVVKFSVVQSAKKEPEELNF